MERRDSRVDGEFAILIYKSEFVFNFNKMSFYEDDYFLSILKTWKLSKGNAYGPGERETVAALNPDNRVPKRGTATHFLEARRHYKNMLKAMDKGNVADAKHYYQMLHYSKVPFEIYHMDTYNRLVDANRTQWDEIPQPGQFTYPDHLNPTNDNAHDFINEPEIMIIEDNPEPADEMVAPISKKRKIPTGKGYISVYNTQAAFEGPSFDTQYCDFAVVAPVEESGWCQNTILNLPLDYTTGRTSDSIRVYKIDVKGEFKLNFGGSASPRIVFYIDRQPELGTTLLGKPYVKPRSVDDILSKDPLNLGERLLTVAEGEIPNVEGNPNCLCFPNFVNTKSELSDAIVHIYELYKDLNVQAIKGIVGEDVDNIPVKSTFKFSIPCDVNVRFAKRPAGSTTDYGQAIIMNNISFMWIGDYDGGVVSGICYTRCYYHDCLE